ncbi:hypothetical protein KEM48_013765 [Puccinia striiformis f. sp. tritici PST-130]|nr:hypothetical protein KEM48_013765 [Puccinia striiformis f. sp. tritici PST-130]
MMRDVAVPPGFVVLLSFSPAAIGQDVAGLPACATTCLASSLASSGKTCAQTDFACLCKNNDFIKANNDCYQKTCSVGDLKTAAGWGAKTCAAAGVQIAANASPVNTNPQTPVRPSSAAAVSVETVKFFAIGSALVCSMWMI